MIKIAFCDDELAVLDGLCELVSKYRNEKKTEIEYIAYRSPFELMADVEAGKHWDLLIIDVLMPGENGIELAKEIRNYDENVKIVFLTNSPEFAVQSYQVKAYYYQLKPVEEEGFFRILDMVARECDKGKSEKLIIKSKNGITAVGVDDIEYCEVIAHNRILHMKNGDELISPGKMDDLEEKLKPLGNYMRVHRSYLVNMSAVNSISYRSVVMKSGAEIPIPHGKYNNIKKIYMDYIFAQNWIVDGE